MEILGIGPGEFVLILIVLLVVVGPERLPGLARQAANILVRARNWLQTSPDAALVLRARQEIEAELASLKSGLLEVQNVRDEVLGAARQLEESVGSIASTKLDLKSMINAPVGQTIARDQPGATPAVPNDQLIKPDGTPADPNAPHPPTTIELPDGTTTVLAQPLEEQHSNGSAKPSFRHAESALPQAELESINIRLQAIMADMWALQTQLKERGVLDDAWQPPSLNVQLPEQTPEPTPEPTTSHTDGEPLPLVDPYPPMATHIHTPPVVGPPLTDAEAESRLLASAAEYVALYEDPVADAPEPGTPDAPSAAEAPTTSEAEAPLFVSAADDIVLYEDTVAEAAELSTPDTTDAAEAPADTLVEADTESHLLPSAADYSADVSEPSTSDAAETPNDGEPAPTAEQAMLAEADTLAATTRKHRERAQVEQTEDRETVATEEAS